MEAESFILEYNTPWGRSVTGAEFAEMIKTGRLQGEALARYWRMNDFNQPMPEYLTLMLRKSDLDKIIRELKRQTDA